MDQTVCQNERLCSLSVLYTAPQVLSTGKLGKNSKKGVDSPYKPVYNGHIEGKGVFHVI